MTINQVFLAVSCLKILKNVGGQLLFTTTKGNYEILKENLNKFYKIHKRWK